MTFPIILKVRGKIIGHIYVRDISEVPYIAGQQAKLREAMVIVENEQGDRIAVGGPTGEGFCV